MNLLARVSPKSANLFSAKKGHWGWIGRLVERRGRGRGARLAPRRRTPPRRTREVVELAAHVPLEPPIGGWKRVGIAGQVDHDHADGLRRRRATTSRLQASTAL